MAPGSGSDAAKILVIKLSALGDFIQALGPFKAIRQHHATDHVTADDRALCTAGRGLGFV